MLEYLINQGCHRRRCHYAIKMQERKTPSLSNIDDSVQVKRDGNIPAAHLQRQLM